MILSVVALQLTSTQFNESSQVALNTTFSPINVTSVMTILNVTPKSIIKLFPTTSAGSYFAQLVNIDDSLILYEFSQQKSIVSCIFQNSLSIGIQLTPKTQLIINSIAYDLPQSSLLQIDQQTVMQTQQPLDFSNLNVTLNFDQNFTQQFVNRGFETNFNLFYVSDSENCSIVEKKLHCQFQQTGFSNYSTTLIVQVRNSYTAATVSVALLVIALQPQLKDIALSYSPGTTAYLVPNIQNFQSQSWEITGFPLFCVNFKQFLSCSMIDVQVFTVSVKYSVNGVDFNGSFQARLGSQAGYAINGSDIVSEVEKVV